MKKKWMGCLIMVATQHMAIVAQNYLPLKDCFSVGGSLMTGMNSGKGDYMDLSGKPLCYTINADYRHYFCPCFAIGTTYEYITSKHGQNQLRCHFIAPAFTLRYLIDEDKHGILFTLGTGYFHYADRVYQTRYTHSTFNKGYFGLSANIAYEFIIAKKTSMAVKVEFLMADWHFNSDYQPKFTRNDPDEFQSIFESNLCYVSIGFALQLGK